MLALDHSRRQQPFAFAGGMDSAFHDPYLSQSMNTYGPFDATPSYNSIPFSFYDSNSLSSEAPPDTTTLAMFAFQSRRPFDPSSPRSELPPPTLSNTSAASIPSNASSTVGSPYSTHAQPVPSQESWSVRNQGLEVGPTIINNEGYDQAFAGVDLDPEMTFRMQGKVAEDFVGEYTNLSTSQRRSSNSAFSEQPQSCQTTPLPIDVKGSAGGDCLTIDSILEHATSTSTPSLVRTSCTGSSFTISSNEPQKNMHASPRERETMFQSPFTSASPVLKRPPSSSHSFSSATSALAETSSAGKPRISMFSFDAAPQTSTPASAPRFQSHFFTQSSGMFMPPTELSCSFFLAIPPSYKLFRPHKQGSSCLSSIKTLLTLRFCVLTSDFSVRPILDSTYKLLVPRWSSGISRPHNVQCSSRLRHQLGSSVAQPFAA